MSQVAGSGVRQLLWIAPPPWPLRWDPVAGVRSAVVLMEHVAKKKDGTIDLKILPHCTLPLTGVGVVDRIITDLAVLDVTPHGLKVVEMAPGVTREELQSKTGVPLQ